MVKLGIGANILCIFSLVVSSIAVYGFEMGRWLFAGIPVMDILVFSTYASLIVCLLQDLIFKPALSARAVDLSKQVICKGEEMDSIPSKDAAFLIGVVQVKHQHERQRYIVSAVLGIIAFLAVGAYFGSPASEFVALPILLLGPKHIGLLPQGSVVRELNPIFSMQEWSSMLWRIE